MSERIPAEDCASCEGRGYNNGYYWGICSACLGTGKELRDDERKLLEMVDRLIVNRIRWGVR